jgi:transcriptional regulator GlxA family with amidase domain
VDAALQLLLESRLPIKRISQRCGFGSEETMRRSFLRLLALHRKTTALGSALEYRVKFWPA